MKKCWRGSLCERSYILELCSDTVSWDHRVSPKKKNVQKKKQLHKLFDATNMNYKLSE